MNREELKKYLLAEEAHSFAGWDFSYLDGRMTEQSLSWDYREIVNRYRIDSQKLLDMGTGDGEFLLKFNHPHQNTAVTEAYPPNIALCREKLLPLGIRVRGITRDDSLPFADKSFDIIINRHEAYDVGEVFRILKPGGFFITQQVGGENDGSLSRRLIDGFTPRFAHNNLFECTKVLREAGFEILFAKEEFPKAEFGDIGAVVYFAKIIPWEFPGFSVETCFDKLYEIYQDFQNGKKLVTYQHRFIIAARKI